MNDKTEGNSINVNFSLHKIKTDNKPEIQGKIILSRGIRYTIFWVFVIVSIIVAADSGVFSSASKDIKKGLEINDYSFGMLNSLASVGRIIGNKHAK